MAAKIYALVFSIILAASSSLATSTVTYVLAKDQSKIEFVARTKNSSVNGSFSDFTISAQTSGPKLTEVMIKASVATASLNTQNSSRDKHLRSDDFLWTEKYPAATFETTRLTQKSEGLFQVEGRLSLRGVTKNIVFETKVEQKAENLTQTMRLTGEFTINRQDFGISYQPFFLLPRIQDDVKIRFNLVAIAKSTTPSS